MPATIPSFRILHVEDSHVDATVLRKYLNKSGLDFELRWITDLGKFKNEIDSAYWDVVVTDYHLDGFTGLDVIRHVKMIDADIPVIVFSGTIGDEYAVETMKVGARDYILKRNVKRFVPVLRRELIDLNSRRERKALANNLKEKQFLEKRFLDALPVMIWLKDGEGNVLRVNKMAAQAIGKHEQELVGRNITEIFPGTGMEDIATDKQIIASQQPMLGIVQKYRTVQGTMRWERMDKIPYLSTDGQVRGVMSFGVDITDLKQAEARTKHLEERFKTALQASEVGVWEWNINEHYFYVNEKFLSDLGFDPDEFQYNEWFFFHIISHQHKKPVRRAIRAYLQEDTSILDYEFSIDAPARPCWVQARGKVIERDKTGRPVRLMGTFLDVTDRVLVVKALEESQDRLVESQRIAKLGHWEYSMLTKDIRWSAGMFHIFGMSRVSHIPKINELLQYIYPDDRRLVRQQIYKLFRARKSIRFDFRIVGQQGVRWLRTSAYLEWNWQDNQVLKVKGITQDITGQKQTVLSLEKSEQRLRTVIDQASDGIFVFNHNGRLDEVNESACKMLGLTQEELLATNLEELIQNKDVKAFIRELIDADGENVFVEYLELKHALGNLIYVECNSKILSDGRMMTIARDLTEKMETEARLRETLARNQAILKAIPDELFINDNNGNFLDYHIPHEYSLFSSTYSGKNIKDIYRGEVLEKYLQAFEKTLATQQPQKIEYSISKQNNRQFFEARLIAFDNDKILTILRNITKFRQAQDDLETFMYKASHNLKGPLASIQGLLSLSLLEVKDPEASSYLGMINKSTTQLDKTLDELINVTKIKQYGLNYANINLDELLGELKGRFGRIEEFNNVKFDVKYDEGLSFKSDYNLLFTMLYNLLENSFRFRRPRHDAHVYLDIRRENGHIKIIVMDNGQGIRKELQEKVFQMFFRGNEDSAGAGLGLYIVRETLNKLNGSVDMLSEENIGSTFTVKLPLHISNGNDSNYFYNG